MNKNKAMICKFHKTIFHSQQDTETFKCWKWDILQFHEKHQLVLNMMAATSLKKLWRDHVYHCVASSSFKNSSGNWGHQMGKKCCPILAWSTIVPAQKSWVFFEGFWISWCTKYFQLVKGLVCRQVSPAHELLYYEAMQFYKCIMWFSIVLLKYARPMVRPG